VQDAGRRGETVGSWQEEKKRGNEEIEGRLPGVNLMKRLSKKGYW
jgi:hypothetical protein